MIRSTYILLYLFFIYGFFGWILETVYAATKQRQFVNRGLINGPVCTIYGFTAILMTIGLHELDGGWLFLGAVIYATSMEWIAGHLIEKIYKERWWDYSGMKWNLDGYICLRASVVWGILGVVIIKWGNHWMVQLYEMVPELPAQIILWIAVGLYVIDALASYIPATGKSAKWERWMDEHYDDTVMERIYPNAKSK
ncbi:MAG: hypothetical protein EOM40_10885 [Clostridia bacterium]|nr:hypothetical protein [Clostridia bacterium]NCC43268.1 hypothetical protein [Clostridia bacterium]